MLFARTYQIYEYSSLRDAITRDLGRGYSWWAGEDHPGLVREPDFVSFEELAASVPERAEDLMSRNNERDSQPTPPGKWRLSGLCAICAATTYGELLQGIWKDFDDRTRWIAGHKYIITIFEGELAGYDPDEWPLFTQGKLLAIAATDAIRRASDTPA
jgi:hypothetical protein